MKWLIIIGLLLFVFVFVFTRYRRQIQTALQFWQMFRQYRKATKPVEKKAENLPVNNHENLIRCAKCGKWTAESQVLKLGSKTAYCSTACMEKQARLESLVDR